MTRSPPRALGWTPGLKLKCRVTGLCSGAAVCARIRINGQRPPPRYLSRSSTSMGRLAAAGRPADGQSSTCSGSAATHSMAAVGLARTGRCLSVHGRARGIKLGPRLSALIDVIGCALRSVLPRVGREHRGGQGAPSAIIVGGDLAARRCECSTAAPMSGSTACLRQWPESPSPCRPRPTRSRAAARTHRRL